MIKIDYPIHSFKIREEENKKVIFDEFRRLWVSLTDEEWVRQNFLQYLVQVRQYPSTLIAVEKEIRLGELKKRFDILVYNAGHKPWMMIECKAMEVVLTENVLHQVLRYNQSVPVPFLVITNGKHMIGFERKDSSLIMLNELPSLTS
ncbi:MAG: type I restriction enzyme HsdR N-terminal domain-containing protein [Chitinophagaceae bacterium]